MSALTTDTKQLKNLLEGVDCKITGNIEETEINKLIFEYDTKWLETSYNYLGYDKFDNKSFTEKADSRTTSFLINNLGGEV